MAGHESDEERAGDRDPEWDALFLRWELLRFIGLMLVAEADK